MSATLDFIFEELPLMSDADRRGMLVNGKAEIAFEEDGSWRVSRIWFDAYACNPFTVVPADPMEVLEKNWFETALWGVVVKALHSDPWRGAVQADVTGAIEDGAFNDEPDRYDLAAFPGAHVEHHPSISF